MLSLSLVEGLGALPNPLRLRAGGTARSSKEFVGAVTDADLTAALAAGLFGDYSADTISSFDDFTLWT